MCGIAGLIRFDGKPIDVRLLRKMAAIQRHRGPDDEGFYHDGLVGLAFRRLAILDLTPTGHQPMATADGTLWIVFNGEIYNHAQLRVELMAKGYHFRSTSDTEVILAAYQEWGEACLSRFNGMWAFAIWNQQTRQLFCARDRLGIKPFYYHSNVNRLLFASEIKTLFADQDVRPRPLESTVYNYLVYGRVQSLAQTFWQEIHQLPAAHYMLVDDTGIVFHRYWHLDHTQYKLTIDDKSALEEFSHLLHDSIRLRLQSDVPVGTCLSGGLDSSTIVGIANRILFDGIHSPDRTVVGDYQKTFSACYVDPSFDERPFIHRVVADTAAKSHEIFPQAEGLFSELEQMIWHQDEPVSSTSIYAQWCVMRAAREAGVVVMLDGQGGDEVTGGYQPYYWTHIAGLLRSLRLKEVVSETQGGWGSRIRPTRTDLLGTAYAFMPMSVQSFAKASQKHWQAREWLGSDFSFSLPQSQIHSTHPTWLGQYLERDLLLDSIPALLKYEDRSSMAHSIEARVPFLDYRLVEFMASMPDKMKIRNGQMKWLLRQAIQGVVPEAVRLRRDKMGFGTPENDWLKSRPAMLKHLFADADSVRRGWLNGSKIQRILDDPKALARLDHRILWRWINIELWSKKFGAI
jgi:asparagine synthase (glutamine-hydrolysing)